MKFCCWHWPFDGQDGEALLKVTQRKLMERNFSLCYINGMDHEIIDFLLKYNTNAPRYTSYPPANLFHAAKDLSQIERLWRESNALKPQNVSFYFHIPYCLKHCLFCGCTSELLPADGSGSERYFAALFAEMDKKLPWIDSSRPVTQVHFGGGTPTSVPFSYLERILNKLRERFVFAPHAEIAIECNPASIDEKRLRELAKIGFNRVSYGIQDFDPQVLKNIGRDPSLLPIRDLLALSRELHFSGITLDLVSGLPSQTESGFYRSVETAADVHPDRIALYSYAHVPWLKEAQKTLERFAMPTPHEKLSFFLGAREIFKKAGFMDVGMDHFVDPADSWAIALSQGLLHRNFQGYCTRATTGEVYAFGSSGISQLDNAYLQNVHESRKYVELVEANAMTEIRCEELSYEERVIRDVIERLMCNRRLAVSDEEKRVVGAGWDRLLDLEKDKLIVKKSENEMEATELGTLVIRYLAMQLDPLMRNAQREGVFSKTI